MATQTLEQVGASAATENVATSTDLIELYYDRGWSDGLPVVPPTQEKIDAAVAALGGDPQFVECMVASRWGILTREILAINMVMAGCRPEYAPVVRAAMMALTDLAFNLNGVQATTHVASPLIVVNGPLAAEVGMNGGANAFGSGNRVNATIGRAVRLIMPNVGGGWPPNFDKSPLGHPGKYTYCVAENEADNPFAPYRVEQATALRTRPSSRSPLIAEIAANNELVLTAIGDCGSCCSCCIRDCVALEKLGIPSAAIITIEFEKETKLTRTVLGMHGLVPIDVDHPISSIAQAEVEVRAAQVALQAPKVWLGRE